ncbi:ABC transporter substrate-binding protein [Actinobacteria bacterium IMCC26103]|nr:ABC transporter substrate-binding protein [Actinobacteria bacterium IMCC26103]
MRKRPLHLASVLAVATLLLSACSGSSDSASTSTGGSSFGAYEKDKAGGIVTFVASAAGGTLDPKVNYTAQYWQLYQASYDGLLGFKYADDAGSFEIVPNLAEALPEVSNDGKTLTFKLRKGIKFSDGSDVTVNDVKASFERIFKVLSPTAGGFYNGIVGADACLKAPATCKLDQGVVVDAATNSVVLNLVAADETIQSKLAVPHAAINPANAPAKDAGTTIIPTTGPYMYKSYDPNKELIMVRNPYFKEWSHDAQPQGYPDEIHFKFGLTATAQVTAVQNDQANWMFDPIPSDRLNEIGTKYADQVHIQPLTAMWYLPMNVNLAPFNNVKARQAVNYALDRAAMVKIFGGEKLAAPVCSFLPPGFPGHVDYCQYTAGGSVESPASAWSAPDIEMAKKLVEESGTKGQKVGIVVSDDEVNKQMGEYIQSVLTEIGYKATLKPISGNIQFTYIQNTNNKVQISLSQWYQDYPAASDFLYILLSCGSFTPGSDSSINMAGYCNKGLDAKMQKAMTLGLTDAAAANKMWGDIDKEVMADAPVAVAFTPKQVDFISKGTKNYHFSKQYKMFVSQLQVK